MEIHDGKIKSFSSVETHVIRIYHEGIVSRQVRMIADILSGGRPFRKADLEPGVHVAVGDHGL